MLARQFAECSAEGPAHPDLPEQPVDEHTNDEGIESRTVLSPPAWTWCRWPAAEQHAPDELDHLLRGVGHVAAAPLAVVLQSVGPKVAVEHAEELMEQCT